MYILPTQVPKLCYHSLARSLDLRKCVLLLPVSAVRTHILPPFSPKQSTSSPFPRSTSTTRFLSPRLFFLSSKSSWDTRREKKLLQHKRRKFLLLSLVLHDGLNLWDICFLKGMFYVLFLQGKIPAPLNPSSLACCHVFRRLANTPALVAEEKKKFSRQNKDRACSYSFSWRE